MQRILLSCATGLLALLASQRAEAVCLGGAPDGRVGPTEGCDDGNNANGDGCSNTCELEGEYSCARAVSFNNLNVQNFPGGNPLANWIIASGVEGVQTNNTSLPTVALFGENAQFGTYAVRMRVEIDTDDDVIGLIMGFSPGDQTNNAANYLVVDWKQGLQEGVPAGLRSAHVRGVPFVNANSWQHGIPTRRCDNTATSCVTQLANGRQLGTTGWADNTSYTAYITYRPDRLELLVNNRLELLLRPSDFPGQFPGNVFPPGQMGFYLHSQDQVRYTNLAPNGASACNLTTLNPTTINAASGTPSVTVNTAALLTDMGDALAPSTVTLLRSVTGGTATIGANGSITFTPTNPNVPGRYQLEVYACDNDPVIPDCDSAIVTINYGIDTDGDGVTDDLDLDDDNDGIPDATERGKDTDGDGAPDDLDLDSDNDGLPDVVEAGHGQPDANGDGLIDCAGGFGVNGLCNAVETAPDSGLGRTPPVDTDGDGIPDFRDLDSDDDGLADRHENGTRCMDRPINNVCDGTDADGDGSPSSADGAPGFGVGGYPVPPDTDGDGTPDYRDSDSDGDGIPDVVENDRGAADTNDDGRVDGPDRDGDGLRDAVDDSDLDGIPDSEDTGPPSFGGGLPVLDTDDDDLPDSRDPDSDDDGLPDSDESGDDPHDPIDSDDDGLPDFQDPDADNDMIADGSDNCPRVDNPDQENQDRDGLGDACDPDANGDGFDDGLGVSGGGCSSGAGAGAGVLLLALGALFTRRRKLALWAALVAVGSAGQAQAQVSSSYSAERFLLTGDRDGILGLEWAEVQGHLTVDLGVWLGYANDPVNVYRMADGDRVGSLVANRFGGDLVAAVQLRDRFELGIAAPIIVSQSQELDSLTGMVPNADLSGFGLGDLRLTPKVTLVRQGRSPASLALMLGVTLPTSTSDDYGGDDGLTASPALLVSRGQAVGLRLAAALGYRVRPAARALDLVVDDEVFGQVGAAYRWASSFEVDGTFDLATGADDVFGAFNRNHAEARLGAGYDVAQSVRAFGALGAGLAEGFGTPDWRVLAGVRVATGGKEPVPVLVPRIVDTDGDGLLDPDDRCVTEPETRNGFEDEDGCPDDADPDGDKVVGAADACPDSAEDLDAFEDTDGCPEPDNDGDDILDGEDACRDIPGVREARGCPDPDRDGDTVVDRLDNCPDEPGEVENHGCKAKQRVKLTGDKLEILDIVYFALNRAEIQRRSFSLLDEVARVLNAHPEISKVRVEGHTDNQGNDAYNKKLSQRRADAVRAYLVRQGVAADRLEAMGYGEEQPKADNASKEGRATNRRVEFTLLGGEGVEVKPTGPTQDTLEQ